MYKKTITILLVISVLMSSMMLPAYADQNEPSAWAKAQVQEAINLGIVPATIQGNYQQAITREEFASLFVTTAFAYQKNNKPEVDDEYYGIHAITREEYLANVKVTDYSFTDTDSEDVKLAYMMGLVNGTSKTTFSPNNKITRQEASVMLVNYAQKNIGPEYKYNETHILDLNQCAPWAKDSMSAAFTKGLLDGVSGNRNMPPFTVNIGPHGHFTREQAIIVAKRAYDLYIFKGIKIRSEIEYVEHALKVDWEISANTVTAIKFKDGMTINGNQDAYYGMWNYYPPSNKYPNATSEQRYAGGHNGVYIHFEVFSIEMIETAVKGENAVFDLGYAEYEMLNKDYIFQYRMKNNGIYNFYTFGGSKELPIKFTRIK